MSNALNSRLFTLLCEDLDTDHKYTGCPKAPCWLAFMN
ncbi:unnamed protein product [Acanthoscelides obtectus]|uniref:Uncharacterized protein n=1 Tax=Acanthoscelides obtectus TaxID=200917 RepID=A0A9P0NXS3_ACAOB|nr:unnamed protein product [Acanthoscelides obtectus]CAK1647826.1 hypothetical protein AOBTE_LOCUS15418 [Acanthoscelides obtectus]